MIDRAAMLASLHDRLPARTVNVGPVLDALASVSPTVWIVAATTLGAALLVGVSVAMVRRRRRRPAAARPAAARPGTAWRRPDRVLHLATQGATTAEMARSTGLARDAITMLLRGPLGPPTARQNRPPAA